MTVTITAWWRYSTYPRDSHQATRHRPARSAHPRLVQICIRFSPDFLSPHATTRAGISQGQEHELVVRERALSERAQGRPDEHQTPDGREGTGGGGLGRWRGRGQRGTPFQHHIRRLATLIFLTRNVSRTFPPRRGADPPPPPQRSLHTKTRPPKATTATCSKKDSSCSKRGCTKRSRYVRRAETGPIGIAEISAKRTAAVRRDALEASKLFWKFRTRKKRHRKMAKSAQS